MTIKLFSTQTSPNSKKIRILLEETGLPYTEVTLRKNSGDNRTPEFLRISPAGTVPALTDSASGAALFESSAILIYLAERARQFLPVSQPERAEVFKWLVFETANIGPDCENIYQLSFLDEEEHAASLRMQKGKLRKATQLLDDQLGGREYVAGACSIADFAVFPWMAMLEDFADVPVSEYGNIARWVERMQERPGLARAWLR